MVLLCPWFLSSLESNVDELATQLAGANVETGVWVPVDRNDYPLDSSGHRVDVVTSGNARQ